MRVKVILLPKNEAGILYNHGGLAVCGSPGAARLGGRLDELNVRGENPKLHRAGSEPRPLRPMAASQYEVGSTQLRRRNS